MAQSVEELRALGEVSQAVNSTIDLETVLSTIIAKAVQLSGTDAGTIYVFDEVQPGISDSAPATGWTRSWSRPSKATQRHGRDDGQCSDDGAPTDAGCRY